MLKRLCRITSPLCTRNWSRFRVNARWSLGTYFKCHHTLPRRLGNSGHGLAPTQAYQEHVTAVSSCHANRGLKVTMRLLPCFASVVNLRRQKMENLCFVSCFFMFKMCPFHLYARCIRNKCTEKNTAA